MLSHCYAAEAVMGALAGRLGQDEEKWKIAGLLHDLDIEIVDNDLDRHGLETEKILKEKGSMPELSTPLLCIMKEQAERNEALFQHALAAQNDYRIDRCHRSVYPTRSLPA